jgi:hypothetical protein
MLTCGTGRSAGHWGVPKHASAAWDNGQMPKDLQRRCAARCHFCNVASAAAAPWLLLRHCVKSTEKSHGTIGEVASRLELRGGVLSDLGDSGRPPALGSALIGRVLGRERRGFEPVDPV